MPSLRTFIALETPEKERELFSRLQSGLRESNADVKWEQESKFHSTLKFLGDTEDSLIPTIKTHIAAICRENSPFTLMFDSIGFFPNWRNPRVLWIGCSAHGPQVTRIKNLLDKILAPMGFEIENRTFHPHITLGRIRSDNGVKHLLSIAENLTFEPSLIAMKELTLVKSILRPEGSEYSVLEKFLLGSQEQ
jgi:RNA 2',3'-cyclic 3'-phosphodiesterase